MSIPVFNAAHAPAVDLAGKFAIGGAEKVVRRASVSFKESLLNQVVLDELCGFVIGSRACLLSGVCLWTVPVVDHFLIDLGQGNRRVTIPCYPAAHGG